MLAKILAQLLHTYLLHMYIYVCIYIKIYIYRYSLIFTNIVPKLTMYFREFFFLVTFSFEQFAHTCTIYTTRAGVLYRHWQLGRYTPKDNKPSRLPGIGDASCFPYFSLLALSTLGIYSCQNIVITNISHKNKTHLLPNPTPNLSTFKQNGLIHGIAPALSLSAVELNLGTKKIRPRSKFSTFKPTCFYFLNLRKI